MSLTPGIHKISAEEYHADPCATPSLSKSLIHTLISRSPAHARYNHPKLNPGLKREEERKFDLGTACHQLMLEGRNGVRVIEGPIWNTNEKKALVAEARAEGKIPLKPDEFERAQEMCDAVLAQLAATSIAPPLFHNGRPEMTLIWEEKGVLCRALADWLHDDCETIDDYKTTRASAKHDDWQRTAYGIGADIQAAFYTRGLVALEFVEPDFRFCVCEVTPPYATSVVRLSDEAMQVANAKIDYALDVWRGCLESGFWPTYSDRVEEIHPPRWEVEAWPETIDVWEAA